MGSKKKWTKKNFSSPLPPLPTITPDARFDPNHPKPTLQDVLDRIRKGYYVPHQCLQAVVEQVEAYHAWHLAAKRRQIELEAELQRKIDEQGRLVQMGRTLIRKAERVPGSHADSISPRGISASYLSRPA